MPLMAADARRHWGTAHRGEGRIHMLHSTLGTVAHGLEASGVAEPALAPLGSFVRQEYAADCARFLADLKERTASPEIANSPATPARR